MNVAREKRFERDGNETSTSPARRKQRTTIKSIRNDTFTLWLSNNGRRWLVLRSKGEFSLFCTQSEVRMKDRCKRKGEKMRKRRHY